MGVIIVLGDSLFSKHNIVELVKKKKMSFIFTAKPGDHKHMFSWIEEYGELQSFTVTDDNGIRYVYSWANEVPLGSREDSHSVNFFKLEMYVPDKKAQNLN